MHIDAEGAEFDIMHNIDYKSIDIKKIFFEKITPILLSFIDELGVEVLLNKDTVALASTGSDITKAAIAKINSQLKN